MRIHLETVSKRYQTPHMQTQALDSVSLTVESGEFLAVMGPSGCGKSTLLHVLGLLENPDSGRILLDKIDVYQQGKSKCHRYRNRHMSFIFQNFHLLHDLNVIDNVKLPLVYAGVAKKIAIERAQSLLEKLGLGHRAQHLPYQISGGQKQRVAIARAMITEPDILLADEPTGNLDEKSGEQVMKLLKLLNQDNISVIMVTHTPEHARYASRVVTMRDGRILS